CARGRYYGFDYW
nr:immunoglobulin heavy chain junction region [Mus musculus]